MSEAWLKSEDATSNTYPSKVLSANGFNSMKSAWTDLAVWLRPAAAVSSFPLWTWYYIAYEMTKVREDSADDEYARFSISCERTHQKI